MYLAVLYKDVHAYNKSIEIYRRVIDLKKETKDEKGLAACYRNLSNVFRKNQMYDSAFYYAFEKAYKMFGDLDNINVQSKILNDIGLICYEGKQYRLAVDYYFEALALVKGKSTRLQGVQRPTITQGMRY